MSRRDAPPRRRARRAWPDVEAPASGSLLDAWDAHVAVLDATGRIVEVNRAWTRFGEDNGGDGAARGVDYLAVLERAARTEPLATQALKGLRSVLAGTADDFAVEYPCHAPDQQRWFRFTTRSVWVEGRTRVLAIHEDVTAARRLRQTTFADAALLDEVDSAVVAVDLAGIVTGWNRAAERIYGWPAAAALGRSILDLTVPLDLRDDPGNMARDLHAHGKWEGEVQVTRRDGTRVPALVRNLLLRDADGEVTGTVWIAADLSDHATLERRLTRSNHELQAITRSVGEGLCTLDADGRITHVNDVGLWLLGADLADVLGEQLLPRLRPAGMSGSATMIPPGADPSRPVRAQLARPDGSEQPVEYVATALTDVDLGAPTGWIVILRDASDREARETGRRERAEQLHWLERIRHALENDGFVLHAQPIVDLATGRTVQHELLLRMRELHDREVLITPGAFLPTAEALGLAATIDRWVLRRGLEIAATGKPVELNLSANSLDGPDLADHIEQLLEETGADPADVVLEITETALIGNDAAAGRFAHRIRELGCTLALDDFGAGYGGFAYLKWLPVDHLKIDIEFVRDVVANPASRHVVAAVVSLARAFGLGTIAEGVEDQPTLELLRELGVDLAQGYLLGRPAPLSPVPLTIAEPSP